MKKLFGIVSLALLLTAVSCSKDSDMGFDVTYSDELAEVTYIGSDGYFEMRWDEGPLLNVVENARPDYQLYVGQRVYFKMRILSYADKNGDICNVKVIDFHNLATSEVRAISDIGQDEWEAIGNDGVSVNKEWIAGNWFNTEFSFLRDDPDREHRFTLIWDDQYKPEDSTDDGSAADNTQEAGDMKEVHFILRHNANRNKGEDLTNSSGETRYDTGLGSFDIEKVMAEYPEQVKVIIHWEDYDTQTMELKEFSKEVGIYSRTKAAFGETVITEKNRNYIGPPVNTSTFVR